MSWSPDIHIGDTRPWPDTVHVVRGKTDETRRYVPETAYAMLHDRHREASMDAERWERVAHDHERFCDSLKKKNADLRRMLRERDTENDRLMALAKRLMPLADRGLMDLGDGEFATVMDEAKELGVWEQI